MNTVHAWVDAIRAAAMAIGFKSMILVDHSVLNAVDGGNLDDDSYLDSHTYGAARFGEFGEYMTRKRAKLQVQNVEMVDGEDETGQRSKIFSGLQIYVRLLRVSQHRLRLTSSVDQWLD